MRFLKNLIYSYFAIIIGFISSIVSVPVIIREYGTELFSFWSMIFGISLYITTAAFGVPSAANVAVAGLRTPSAIRRSIRNAFHLLSIISVTITSIGVIYTLINPEWINIFGHVSQDKIPMLQLSVAILLLLSLVRLPFTLFQQLFIAFNLVYIERSYQIFLAVLILAAYLLAVFFHLGFAAFSAIVGAAGVIVSLSAFYHLHMYLKSTADEDALYEEHISLSGMAKQALPFFQIGIAQAITWNCGTFIISHMMDASSAAPFVVAIKFVIFAVYTFLIVNNVFFPLYSRAYAEGNMESVNRFYGYALSFLPAAGGMIWIGAMFFYKDIAILWTGKPEIYTGPWMMSFLGGFMYFLAFSNSHNILLQTIKASGISAWISWIEALICLAVSVLFTRFLGAVGPAAGIFTATLITSLFILPRSVRLYTEGKVGYNYSVHFSHFIKVLMPCLIVGFFVSDRMELPMKILVFMFTASAYVTLTGLILPKGIISDIKNLKWKR